MPQCTVSCKAARVCQWTPCLWCVCVWLPCALSAHWQMNATSGLDEGCVSHYQGSGNEWMCIFAEHTSPFLTTPTFPLQSGASYAAGVALCATLCHGVEPIRALPLVFSAPHTSYLSPTVHPTAHKHSQPQPSHTRTLTRKPPSFTHTPSHTITCHTNTPTCHTY